MIVDLTEKIGVSELINKRVIKGTNKNINIIRLPFLKLSDFTVKNAK